MLNLTYDFEYGDTLALNKVNAALREMRLSSLEVADIDPYLEIAMENPGGGQKRPKVDYHLGIARLVLEADDSGEELAVYQVDGTVFKKGEVPEVEDLADRWCLENPECELESIMQFEFEGEDVECFVIVSTLGAE